MMKITTSSPIYFGDWLTCYLFQQVFAELVQEKHNQAQSKWKVDGLKEWQHTHNRTTRACAKFCVFRTVETVLTQFKQGGRAWERGGLILWMEDLSLLKSNLKIRILVERAIVNQSIEYCTGRAQRHNQPTTTVRMIPSDDDVMSASKKPALIKTSPSGIQQNYNHFFCV